MDQVVQQQWPQYRELATLPTTYTSLKWWMKQSIAARHMTILYPKVLDHAKGPIFPKMTYYEDHFMHFTEDGLRERPRYIEIEARQALCKPRVEIFWKYVNERLKARNILCRCPVTSMCLSYIREKYATIYVNHNLPPSLPISASSHQREIKTGCT